MNLRKFTYWIEWRGESVDTAGAIGVGGGGWLAAGGFIG
jgi:hypothetical protein